MRMPIIIKAAADQSAEYGNTKDPSKRKTPVMAYKRRQDAMRQAADPDMR